MVYGNCGHHRTILTIFYCVLHGWKHGTYMYTYRFFLSTNTVRAIELVGYQWMIFSANKVLSLMLGFNTIVNFALCIAVSNSHLHWDHYHSDF